MDVLLPLGSAYLYDQTFFPPLWHTHKINTDHILMLRICVSTIRPQIKAFVLRKTLCVSIWILSASEMNSLVKRNRNWDLPCQKMTSWSKMMHTTHTWLGVEGWSCAIISTVWSILSLLAACQHVWVYIMRKTCTWQYLVLHTTNSALIKTTLMMSSDLQERETENSTRAQASWGTYKEHCTIICLVESSTVSVFLIGAQLRSSTWGFKLDEPDLESVQDSNTDQRKTKTLHRNVEDFPTETLSSSKTHITF